MNSQEIETALRCKTPIVILIWNDSQYGLIEWKQKRRFGRSAYIDFKNPNFVDYAKSFGATGVRIESAEDLLPALEEALKTPVVTDRDIAGVIQMFEFCYELSWKYLKFKLEEAGVVSTTPKDVLTKAYQNKIIHDEKIWLDIIKDRNLSVHTYNKLLADELVEKIKDK
jgi:nucleotidyltransferase substrate binding protein (TIGR01987 family)